MLLGFGLVIPVLGVILLFGGLELAAAGTTEEAAPQDRAVLVLTAGLALWNMGAAYLTGRCSTTRSGGASSRSDWRAPAAQITAGTPERTRRGPPRGRPA